MRNFASFTSILFSAFVLFFGFAYQTIYAAGTQYSVVLNGDGFEPATLTIPRGSTVVFKTVKDRYFWPASNDHPDHTIYPEFDPKKPIAPEQTWSFTFEKTGDWGFHDHISPYYTGVIHVTDGNAQNNPGIQEKHGILTLYQHLEDLLNNFITQNLIYLDLSRCKSPVLSRSQRISCWEHVVITIVHKKGLRATLAFIERQKNENVAFAADCHVYVHRVGEEYYWQFIHQKSVEISDKFALCDMGFFHGFMQEFTSHSQQLGQAKRYCDLVQSMSPDKKRTEELLQQCYHGIGHGLAYLYAPSHWGNTDEIMRLGIADCIQLVSNPRECINGVYGGLAAMYWGLHGFSLKMDHADPFALCAHQPDAYVAGCFNQMTPVVFGEFGSSLKTAGPVIESIKNTDIRLLTMEHLGSMPSYTIVPKTNDYSQIIEDCRTFADPLRLACLRGFSGALMRIGPFGEALHRSVTFCQAGGLTEEEKNGCYLAVRRQIYYLFGTREAKAFCQIVRVNEPTYSCTDDMNF